MLLVILLLLNNPTHCNNVNNLLSFSPKVVLQRLQYVHNQPYPLMNQRVFQREYFNEL